MAPADSRDTAAIRFAFSRLGAFVDRTGTVIAAVPPVDSLYVREYGKIVRSTRDQLDVVWETHLPAQKSPENTRLERVQLGLHGWTRPQTVFEAYAVRTGPVVVNRPGSSNLPVAFAAILVDTARHPSVQVARETPRGWARYVMPDAGVASAFSAVPTRDGGTVVLAMGMLSDRPSGVYARTLSPSGEWSTPILIDSLSGSHEFYSVAALGADSIAVVWVQNGNAGSQLKTAISADAKNWRMIGPITSARMDSPTIAVDAAGRLHVVFRSSQQDVLNSPGVIRHSVLDHGHWTAPVTVSSAESLVRPTLGAVGDGLMLTWADGVWFQTAPMPRSQIQFWSPGCK